MQAGIKIQTSKIQIANQLIEHIKSEKLVFHTKINQAEEDLQDILDAVKRKLKISLYIALLARICNSLTRNFLNSRDSPTSLINDLFQQR